MPLRDRTRIVFALALLLFVAVACAGDEGDVAFADMIADPARYHGSELCTNGVYLTGFEVSALGAYEHRIW